MRADYRQAPVRSPPAKGNGEQAPGWNGTGGGHISAACAVFILRPSHLLICSRLPLDLPSRLNGTAALAEADAAEPVPLAIAAQDDRVTVFEEATHLAV
jgi:hypothetical protein